MEKRRSGEKGVALARALLLAFFITAVLFIIGILISALLIYRGICAEAYSMPMLCVVHAAAAFGAALFLSRYSGKRALLPGLAVQSVFLILLVCLGAALQTGGLNWVQFGCAAAAVFLASAAGSLFFGGRKNKKFQKNAVIRLKKR